MFRISSRRVATVLLAALLLSVGAGCQRWSLVMLDLAGIPELDQIASLRARVHEVRNGDADAGGYVHDGMSDANQAFQKHASVGVYLPAGIIQFSVVVDALDKHGCPILTGSGIFRVDAPAATLTLTLPTDETCQPVVADGSSDASDVGAAQPDVTQPDVAPPDAGQSDLADAGFDAADGLGSDQVECGVDTAPPIACFDPSFDAGAPDPFDEATPNHECDAYCDDMISACPSVFADHAGCVTVCTEAGWRLPPDGSADGTVLSCLARDARAAVAAVPGSCTNADPSRDRCISACTSYCTLRQRFCGDASSMEPDCLAKCFSLSDIGKTALVCLMQVMEHDVPADRRFCDWTGLGRSCGRCAEH